MLEDREKLNDVITDHPAGVKLQLLFQPQHERHDSSFIFIHNRYNRYHTSRQANFPGIDFKLGFTKQFALAFEADDSYNKLKTTWSCRSKSLCLRCKRQEARSIIHP